MTDRDDTALFADLARELPRIDIDEPSAQRIGQHARQAVGRRLPLTRYAEPVLVVLFELSLISWTVMKLVEVLG